VHEEGVRRMVEDGPEAPLTLFEPLCRCVVGIYTQIIPLPPVSGEGIRESPAAVR
jgi:hypothetical protein